MTSPKEDLPSSPLLRKYKIVETWTLVRAHGYRTVALQFPDALLDEGPAVVTLLDKVATQQLQHHHHQDDELVNSTNNTGPAHSLSMATQITFVMLGDSTYGECCADEIAAQHINADVIIHYGDACLSPPRNIPVCFVFQDALDISVEQAFYFVRRVAQYQLTHSNAKMLVAVDLPYLYLQDALRHHIHSHLGTYSQQIYFSNLPTDPFILYADTDSAEAEQNPAANSCSFGMLHFVDQQLTRHIRTDDHPPPSVVWIGHDDSSSLNIARIEHPHWHVSLCSKQSLLDLNQSNQISTDENFRFLKKRLPLIEAIQQANTVAIVAGTLAIKNQLQVIELCKQLICRANKRVYTLVVGRLTPEKLANFPEIDVFVLIACPKNSIIETKPYYRPLVSAFDLEIALTDKLDALIKGYNTKLDGILERNPDLVDRKDVETSADLIVRDKWDLSVSGQGSAAEFFAKRTFQGLQADTGNLVPSKALPGRAGIASGYENEPAHKG